MSAVVTPGDEELLHSSLQELLLRGPPLLNDAVGRQSKRVSQESRDGCLEFDALCEQLLQVCREAAEAEAVETHRDERVLVARASLEGRRPRARLSQCARRALLLDERLVRRVELAPDARNGAEDQL